MLKTSGLLTYTIGPIAGAGGSASKALLVDPDDKGDFYDPARLNPQVDYLSLMSAVFVPSALATAASDGGRCRVVPSSQVVNGILTSLSVQVLNDSVGAGDTVTGKLYVTLQHGENMAV